MVLTLVEDVRYFLSKNKQVTTSSFSKNEHDSRLFLFYVFSLLFCTSVCGAKTALSIAINALTEQRYFYLDLVNFFIGSCSKSRVQLQSADVYSNKLEAAGEAWGDQRFAY